MSQQAAQHIIGEATKLQYKILAPLHTHTQGIKFPLLAYFQGLQEICSR